MALQLGFGHGLLHRRDVERVLLIFVQYFDIAVSQPFLDLVAQFARIVRFVAAQSIRAVPVSVEVGAILALVSESG